MDLWQKLYYKYQKDYVRKRLLAIKYLYEGKNRTEVSAIIGCNYKKLLIEKQVIDRQDALKLNERDAQRRKRVLERYHGNALKTGLDFYHAAMIFQHGDDPGDYLLAHDLAIAALTFKDKGAEEAKWLIAATQDRFLMHLGRPQRFGTQQITTKPNANNFRCASIYNLDNSPASVTDEHRQILNVPTLKQAQEKLEEWNKKCKD